MDAKQRMRDTTFDRTDGQTAPVTKCEVLTQYTWYQYVHTCEVLGPVSTAQVCTAAVYGTDGWRLELWSDSLPADYQSKAIQDTYFSNMTHKEEFDEQ